MVIPCCKLFIFSFSYHQIEPWNCPPKNTITFFLVTRNFHNLKISFNFFPWCVHTNFLFYFIFPTSSFCTSRIFSLTKHNTLHWIFFSKFFQNFFKKKILITTKKTIGSYIDVHVLCEVLFKLELNVFNTKLESG
jgi:hypothetical protein